MDVLALYKRGWAEVQKHLVAWMVLYTVFLLVTLGTCGLGAVLWPNLMREIRDALAEDRAPGLSTLFRTDRLTNDLINYLVYFGAMTVGGAMGGIGGSVAALFLQMLMPLAAEDRYAPLDNARISAKHVMAHLGDHVVFLAVGTGVGMLAVVTCLLALPLVGPVMGVAHWLWYQEARFELDALALDLGIRQIGDTGGAG